jgi:holo-[acyl-carrier protein] synthase
VGWTEIEVDCDQRRRPILKLHGNAARLAADLGLTEWELSLSHTQTQAVAFVVAMSR